jgi:hypothetical protein
MRVPQPAASAKPEPVMSLSIDFNNIPLFAGREYRLPSGDFLPTSPLRVKADSSNSAHDSEFMPSYRVLNGLAALSEAFRHPLAGVFSPGLVQ